ncbi:MAG: hypothetical protein ABL958_09835 [Bdellovibrionia bacterium]
MAEETKDWAVLVAVTLIFLVPMVLVAIPLTYEILMNLFGLGKDHDEERRKSA